MKHLLYLLVLVSSISYAQVYQPATCHFNGTPTNGVKIKTNIPFTPSSHMPTIIIEGYNYGTSDAIGIMVNYYLFSATPADTATYYFVKHNATSYGGYTPVIKLAKENNKIVIYIDSRDYFIRFMVRAFSKGLAEQASWFEGWTVVDEALTGTAQVTVPYRNRFKNDVLIDGRVAVRSGSLGGISFTNTANYYVNSINSITGSDSTQAHLAFRVGTANAVMNNLPERMRIDKDGNIGIGTSTPISKLDVNGILTLRSGSVFVNSITPAVSVNGSSQTMRFGYNSSTTSEGFQFYNSNTSANLMMIQGGGNVGIGTYTPTAPLHVEKGIAGNYIGYFNNTDNGASSNGLLVNVANNNANNTVQRWRVAGIEIMRVQANGNVGIGTAAPASKLQITGSTVAGTIASSYRDVLVENTTNAGITIRSNDFSNSALRFNSPSSNSTGFGLLVGDYANNKVQLGTNLANGKLEFLTGNFTSAASILANGNFGVGTAFPYSRFQTSASSGQNEMTPGSPAGVGLTVSNNNNAYGLNMGVHTNGTSWIQAARLDGTATVYNLTLQSAGGNVGIGTTNIPTDYKLAVGGNIIAEKIKVKKQVGGVWPDYVFSPDYKLPHLEEIEEFTKKNKHLPEIPSAKEIEKEGQDLGEMNRLLLKKVEELTLYVIDLKKELTKQNAEIEKLKTR